MASRAIETSGVRLSAQTLADMILSEDQERRRLLRAGADVSEVEKEIDRLHRLFDNR